MRKAPYLALAVLAATVTPSSAAKPDVSLPTLIQLDDRLWAAGDDWRQVFATLHPTQQTALLRLNSQIQFVQTPTGVAAFPPACEVVDCDPITPVPPPATDHPVADVVIQAPPPDDCDSGQIEIVGKNPITGKTLTRALDFVNYCVDADGRFSGYQHGHEATTYGWGWETGSCLCIDKTFPPIPGEEKRHDIMSDQNFNRTIGFGDFGFTDTSTSHVEGWVNAMGPYDGQHSLAGR